MPRLSAPPRIQRVRPFFWMLAVVQIGLIAGFTAGVDYLHNHDAAVPGGEDCPAYQLQVLLSAVLTGVPAAAPVLAATPLVDFPIPLPVAGTPVRRTDTRAPPRSRT